MSADNYVVVDHDGFRFVVKHGSMSAAEDPCYDPPIVARFAKESDVANFIDKEFFIIEYGVEWTPMARAACVPATCKYSISDAEVKKVQNKLDILEVTLEELKTRIHEQKETIHSLQDREQEYILRANNAIFALDGTTGGDDE